MAENNGPTAVDVFAEERHQRFFKEVTLVPRHLWDGYQTLNGRVEIRWNPEWAQELGGTRCFIGQAIVQHPFEFVTFMEQGGDALLYSPVSSPYEHFVAREYGLDMELVRYVFLGVRGMELDQAISFLRDAITAHESQAVMPDPLAYGAAYPMIEN